MMYGAQPMLRVPVPNTRSRKEGYSVSAASLNSESAPLSELKPGQLSDI